MGGSRISDMRSRRLAFEESGANGVVLWLSGLGKCFKGIGLKG